MGVKYQWAVSIADICFLTGLQPYLSGLGSHTPSEVGWVQPLAEYQHADGHANGAPCRGGEHLALLFSSTWHLKAEGTMGRSPASPGQSWNPGPTDKNGCVRCIWVSDGFCCWRLWYAPIFLWGADGQKGVRVASWQAKSINTNKCRMVLFPGTSQRCSRFWKGFTKKEGRGKFSPC